MFSFPIGCWNTSKFVLPRYSSLRSLNWWGRGTRPDESKIRSGRRPPCRNRQITLLPKQQSRYLLVWMTCWHLHLSSQAKTSIQYVQEHYFHYDAKRATDALATGRGQLKGATGTDWMRDPYFHDSEGSRHLEATGSFNYRVNQTPARSTYYSTNT